MKIFIQNVQFVVGKRMANRHQSFRRKSSQRAFEIGAVDGGFRQTEGIDQTSFRIAKIKEFLVFADVPDVRTGNKNAHEAQILAALFEVLNKIAQHRRNELGAVHVFLPHELVQFGAVQQQIARTKNELAARTQGADEIAGEHVKGKARHLQMARSFRSQSILLLPSQIRVHQAGMGNHRPLAFSRGTGGIDDISQVFRDDLTGRRLFAFFGDFRPIRIHASDLRLMRRQSGQTFLLRQQDE